MLLRLGVIGFLLTGTTHVIKRSGSQATVFCSDPQWLVSFLSRVITLLLESRQAPFAGFWESHFQELFPLETLFQEPFTPEVLLTSILAFLLPVVLNLFYDDHSGAEKAAIEAGDHVELLIQESIDDQMPVEVTLRNRKIYIGLGLESGIGTSSDSDIALVPMYSGYRAEDTLNLNIETDYLPVIWELAEYDVEEWSLDEFRVVIPVTEVVSARLFDEELYDEFDHDPIEAARINLADLPDC